MAKPCERILSDFLEPRCRAFLGDPTVSPLLPKLKDASVPIEDQGFKIEKGSLQKVIGLIGKPGPVHWSGTRNGAIALLLFGRKYKVGNGPGEEIDNPLRLFGGEGERQRLRLGL